MSVEASGWTWKHTPYKGVEKLIHLALADSANDMHGFRIFARQAWVADKVGCSRETANRWLKKAVEDGFIRLVKDNSSAGKPNEYVFLMPDVPVTLDPSGGVTRDLTPPVDEEGGVTTDHTGCDVSSQGGVTTDHTETEVETEERQNQPPLRQPSKKADAKMEDGGDNSGQEDNTKLPAVSHQSPTVPEAGTVAAITTEEHGAEEDSTGRQPEQNPEYVRLCHLLADLIADHGVKRPNPDQKRWYDAVRLLVERDGYTVQQVETIIRWAQADSFWCTNILSTPKLRDKFTALRLRRNQEIESRRSGGNKQKSDMDRLKEAQRRYAEEESGQ